MKQWDTGKMAAMVDSIESECWSKLGGHADKDDDEAAKAYNSRVLSGHLRSAVRTLTNRGGGGVMQPDDHCTKDTGKTVLQVLRAKHPAMRDPVLEGSDPACFEYYPSIPPLSSTRRSQPKWSKV